MNERHRTVRRRQAPGEAGELDAETLDKYARTAVFVGRVFIFLGLPYVGVFMWGESPGSAMFAAVVCILWAMIPLLHERGLHKVARALPLVGGASVITYISVMHGPSSGMALFFFCLLPLPPLTYALSERRAHVLQQGILGAASSATLAVWLVLGFSPLSGNSLVDDLPWIPLATLATTFLGTFIMLSLLMEDIRRQQAEFRYQVDRSARAERLADEARERAESASRAKAEFVATVSHEIRTPLNGVLGVAELLHRTKLSPRQRELTDLILSSGRFLGVIITDILDFSKIEAGHLELESTPFWVGALIEQTLDPLVPSAQDKGLSVIVDLDLDGDLQVQGDANRVRQILTNLVNNAIKFTPQGFVEVRATAVREATRWRIEIEVEDSGIGISDDHAERIFQPFSQSDSSTSRRFGGTGLGLTICRQLATQMSGSLSFDSVVGQGTTFTLTIRLADAGARSPTPHLPDYRVALVSPSGRRVRALRAQLERWHLRCHHALKTEDLPLGGPFDVVLLDAMMSEAPDDDARAAVARRVGLAPNQVVELRRREAIEDGTHQLHYPCRRIQLAEALVDAAEQRRPRRDDIGHDRTEEVAFVGVHVLVAEDNPVNQMVLRSFLERFGVTADVVAHGQKAIDTFSTTEHDLVFMDVHMPEVNGLEATQHIRTHADPHRKVPIIATTANANVDMRRHALAHTFDAYLTKPLKLDGIREVLERFLPDHEIGVG